MASSLLAALKSDLDSLVGALELFGSEPRTEEQVTIDEAISNFRAAGPDLLDQATQFLWHYYRSVSSEFEQQQRQEYGIPELIDNADIWREVRLSNPPTIQLGGSRLSPAKSYISFEGEVTWEPEHGLQLVFENGLHICKVGPFDGHNTNAHAYDDENLLGVIFK